MGGNALNIIPAQRLPANRYHRLAFRTINALHQRWPGARPHLVRSYFLKPDFGDMDVIVDAEGFSESVGQGLCAMFACTQVVHNRPVWSCDVDGFQLDLICMPPEDYATAVDYYAWNDCGNLMGRVARRLGFKYGHRGLSYLLRDGDHLVSEIHVSRAMPAIFRFLGYDSPMADYERFRRGFATLGEMFAFVSESRYFDPSAYALEDRNHAARTRDRKRPSYCAFLTWLDTQKVRPGNQCGRDPEAHLQRACEVFPEFAVRLAAERGRHAQRIAHKQKFNGHLVAHWTGRSDKELGALMARCRDNHAGGAEGFNRFVATAAREEIRAYVEQINEGLLDERA